MLRASAESLLDVNYGSGALLLALSEVMKFPG